MTTASRLSLPGLLAGLLLALLLGVPALALPGRAEASLLHL